MKTYLVTGAAGFIGVNFVKYMLEKYGEDIQIIVLDKLTYAGNKESLKDEITDKKIEFVKGDIGNKELVESIFARYDVDYVVNFAAESHVDRSILGPRVFLETNILGTQNLLEVSKDSWTIGRDENGYPVYEEGKKYIQISTDEVYGSLSRDYTEAKELHLDESVKRVVEGRDNLKTYGENFFTEKTPLDPRSPYSSSKASGDMIVQAYAETYKLPINITRCSNNYGPYQFPEKLIPLIIKNILEGKSLPVYGDGSNVRDWLYISDHIKKIEGINLLDYYITPIFKPILKYFIKLKENIVLGFQAIEVVYNIKTRDFGPNARYDVIWEYNFGVVGILGGYLSATLFGFLRRVQTKNFYILNVLVILVLNSEAIITDFTLFGSLLFSLLFCFVPLVILTEIISKGLEENENNLYI